MKNKNICRVPMQVGETIRRYTFGAVCLGLSVLCLLPASYAKPEKLTIKAEGQKSKEDLAKTKLKHISLKNIEDPTARQAIREILNYLNLDAQK